MTVTIFPLREYRYPILWLSTSNAPKVYEVRSKRPPQRATELRSKGSIPELDNFDGHDSALALPPRAVAALGLLCITHKRQSFTSLARWHPHSLPSRCYDFWGTCRSVCFNFSVTVLNYVNMLDNTCKIQIERGLWSIQFLQNVVRCLKYNTRIYYR